MSIEEIRKSVESDEALNTWGIGEAINHIEYLLQALAEKDKEIEYYHDLYQEKESRGDMLEMQNADLTAERERAEKAELEPVHLGFFHNDEEGIVNIYILDKDGNETGRIVKAECLLARISKYFNIAKSAEQERDSLARKLEGIREVCSLLKPMERDISTNKHHMERVMWEKIKAAVEEGE
jgi:hypothetical protein